MVTSYVIHTRLLTHLHTHTHTLHLLTITRTHTPTHTHTHTHTHSHTHSRRAPSDPRTRLQPHRATETHAHIRIGCGWVFDRLLITHSQTYHLSILTHAHFGAAAIHHTTHNPSYHYTRVLRCTIEFLFGKCTQYRMWWSIVQ
jgi:hypothetical protein